MRRTSQLVGLDFSTGRAISPLPVMTSVAGAGLIFMIFREVRRRRRLNSRPRVHICAFAKLLLPAWEIGRRLKTMNLCVHRVSFLACETAQFPLPKFASRLTWHKCGTELRA